MKRSRSFHSIESSQGHSTSVKTDSPPLCSSPTNTSQRQKQESPLCPSNDTFKFLDDTKAEASRYQDQKMNTLETKIITMNIKKEGPKETKEVVKSPRKSLRWESPLHSFEDLVSIPQLDSIPQLESQPSNIPESYRNACTK
jgi:hypothetical protein